MDSEANASVSKTADIKITEDLPPGRKLSVASVHCRICYDNDKPEELIAPCHCKVGSHIYSSHCLQFCLCFQHYLISFFSSFIVKNNCYSSCCHAFIYSHNNILY